MKKFKFPKIDGLKLPGAESEDPTEELTRHLDSLPVEKVNEVGQAYTDLTTALKLDLSQHLFVRFVATDICKSLTDGCQLNELAAYIIILHSLPNLLEDFRGIIGQIRGGGTKQVTEIIYGFCLSEFESFFQFLACEMYGMLARTDDTHYQAIFSYLIAIGTLLSDSQQSWVLRAI